MLGSREQLAGVLLAASVAGAVTAPSWADEIVTDEVVIELVPGHALEEIGLPADAVVVASLVPENVHLVHFPSGGVDEAFLDLLEEHAAVDDAEYHLEAQLAGGQTQGIFYDAVPEEFDGQYSWDLLGLDESHAISHGAGVVVAILDTGVDPDHAALAGRLDPNGFNFIDGTSDVADVGNGVDDDGDGLVDELAGHGTMLAGIVAKIAPDATILPIKVLDSDGRGTSFVIAAGIYHAIEHGARVINLSLGTLDEPDVVLDAVEAARQADVVVVAAVGNADLSSPVQYPAAGGETIAVASTDGDDLKSEFSNFGGHVTLAAPGSDVVSTFPGGIYKRSSGTSLAAAMISGSVALLRATAPQLDDDAIEEHLLESAVGIDGVNPAYVGLLGAGRLDVQAAVDSLAPPVVGDLDEDGEVGLGDLLELLSAWGPCPNPPPSGNACSADLNDDGSVGFADLLIVLSNWS